MKIIYYTVHAFLWLLVVNHCYFCTESKSYNNNNNKNLFNSLLYCLRVNHVIDFENLLILYMRNYYFLLERNIIWNIKSSSYLLWSSFNRIRKSFNLLGKCKLAYITICIKFYLNWKRENMAIKIRDVLTLWP